MTEFFQNHATVFQDIDRISPEFFQDAGKRLEGCRQDVERMFLWFLHGIGGTFTIYFQGVVRIFPGCLSRYFQGVCQDIDRIFAECWHDAGKMLMIYLNNVGRKSTRSSQYHWRTLAEWWQNFGKRLIFTKKGWEPVFLIRGIE